MILHTWSFADHKTGRYHAFSDCMMLEKTLFSPYWRRLRLNSKIHACLVFLILILVKWRNYWILHYIREILISSPIWTQRNLFILLVFFLELWYLICIWVRINRYSSSSNCIWYLHRVFVRSKDILSLVYVLLLLSHLLLVSNPWSHLFWGKINLLVYWFCSYHLLGWYIIYSHFCVCLGSLMSDHILLGEGLLLYQTRFHGKILLVKCLLIDGPLCVLRLIEELVDESFGPLVEIFAFSFQFKLTTLRSVFLGLWHALSNHILVL